MIETKSDVKKRPKIEKVEYDHGKLTEMYSKAKSVDEAMFSEMRSNVLLTNSEHYRKTTEYFNGFTPRNVTQTGLPVDQMKTKIRITKNHIYRIVQKYKDGIAALSPNLRCHPALEAELSCKKAAELYDSVLQYGKERYKLDELREDWLEDFCDMGEVACKIYFDKNRGDIVSYHQAVDEETGLPIFLDQQNKPTPHEQSMDLLTGMPTGQPNQPAPDYDKPIYSGDFVFETIHPFNLKRSPSAETMDESPYLIVDKMMEKEEVQNMLDPNDPKYDEKMDYIKASCESTYKVFKTVSATYEEEKGKCLLHEIYFRPGVEFPRGHFIIWTQGGILFEGELPFGVFPIAWRAFKKVQTTPRGRSIIKILRPFQYELNRMASKQTEHQITHGDDKVITPPGIKMSQGALLSGGVRHFQAAGQPIVIPGRTGDQFVTPYQQTLQEMYQVVDEVPEVPEAPAQLDPYSLLFRSAQRRAKYGKYATTFQSFLKDVYWTYLRLAKEYFDENRYIRSVGSNEAINFAEFKNSKDISIQIKLVEQNEDSESMVGKAMYLQYVLQYVGKQLPPETLGLVLNNLPYANSEQIFKPLVMDQKNLENDLLAMDRGEQRPAQPEDNHDFYVKGLTFRMKQPDFKLLAPQIQQAYQAKKQQHQQFLAQQQQQIQLATQGQIPMTGTLAKCDVYAMVDGKQTRITLPTDALEWVKNKLDQQGMNQQRLQTMSLGDQAAISQQVMAMQNSQANANQGMPGQPQPNQQMQTPQGVR